MNKAKTTRFIIFSGLFTALGILLPSVFHIFGAASGQAFLPMHIPVLIAGLSVSPLCGAVVGVLSPFLSSVISSMPSFFKMPFMCIELFVYGLCSGLFLRLFSKHFKSSLVPIYLSLVCAQICGRLVNLACTFIAVNLLGLTIPGTGVMLALASIPAGFLGIVIQWIFIPPVVKGISYIQKK